MTPTNPTLHRYASRTLGALLALIMLLATVNGAGRTPPARATSSQGACAALTADQPHSDACNAEIAAHALPPLEHPVSYDRVRDGEARPRSILLPDDPFPYPVGWQRRAWYFSDVPGVLPADDDWTNARRIARETMYYIYTSVEVDGTVWHLIGPDQWMDDEHVSVLRIPERPLNVSGRWAAIDLNQQTLIALIDDTPLFVTLISSGYWLETTPGLFHIEARTESMIMRGPPGAEPPLYEFYTKWVMFFNGHQGLHAMPYHNKFGIRRTHGCVNVPPGDEKWLWDFFAETADEWHPNYPETFHVDHPEAAPWIYAYHSPALPAWHGW